MSFKRSRAAFEADDKPPQYAPFALYGTPLPPYDPDARDDGSYVPIWKQEVTDERGRKRLHGAFTGGFSAGYFNTVGSKEGWTPTTFVSSRSNRQKDKDGTQRQQRAEDFMDHEDLAEQAESQKLETQGAFAGLGSTESGASSKGMFADLFRTTGETMGTKLLQRMGWRQGQGVGPKVKRRLKGDTKGEMHSFAPENSRMITFNRKTDRKGLGFAGEGRWEGSVPDQTGENEEDDGSDHDARILQSHRSKVLTKPKRLKKSGLGIGVLNDTGSDEEDAYSMGPKISYNRVIGGDKKKKKAGLTASSANSGVSRPTFTSKKLTQQITTSTGFRKCHDGRLPLDGFILTLRPLTLLLENKHPPPAVPDGWKPAKSSQSTSELQTSYQSTADAAKTSSLDPKARAALLGEQQLPGKSVFDFMSPAARDRLANASGKANLPPALGEAAPSGYTMSEAEKRRTLWDLVPDLDRQAAAAALQRGSSGWMPYAEDEDKRARYKYFLELRAGLQSNLPERPKTFSIDEWAKELQEFAQAAEVFKPVSGLMASRFTSSSSTPRLASDALESSAHPAQKEDDPAERAAKMGMYGPMTRSRHTFFPTRLLCKRFNVKPPANVAVDPGGAPDGTDDVVPENRRLDVVSQASIARMMQEANFNKPGGFVSAGTVGGEVSNDRSRYEPAEMDAERNHALERQRAGEDVFRAVFGGEDED